MNEQAFIILIKTYAPAIIATLFGALAHALENIRNSGWKGWFSLSSDIIVCSFVGYSFFHLAQLIYPDAYIIFTSVGSYWGTKGYVLIKDWFVNSIKANVK